MKLYQLTMPVRVRGTCSDGSTYCDVKHIDGTYSFGKTEKGNIVHLSATADLVANEDGTWSCA